MVKYLYFNVKSQSIVLFVVMLFFLTSGLYATYNRQQAVRYANKWVDPTEQTKLRNNSYKIGDDSEYPFIDHDKNGGDCANFVSQCLIAGTSNLLAGINDTRHSIPFCDNLHSFLIENNRATITAFHFTDYQDGTRPPQNIAPGDVVIVGDYPYDEGDDPWRHACIVVEVKQNGEILLNCHNNDRYKRNYTWWFGGGSAQFPYIQFYHINDNFSYPPDLKPNTLSWYSDAFVVSNSTGDRSMDNEFSKK